MKAIYFKWIQFFRDREFTKSQYIEDIANFIKLIKLLYELYLIKTLRILYLNLRIKPSTLVLFAAFTFLELIWPLR